MVVRDDRQTNTCKVILFDHRVGMGLRAIVYLILLWVAVALVYQLHGRLHATQENSRTNLQ